MAGYRIDRLLGKGGMAEVYLATDVDLQRKVAIKIMMAVPEQQAEFKSRFRKEAVTIASLQHANIVSLFDARLNEDPPYLISAYVGGGALEDKLDPRKGGGALGFEPAVRVAMEIARALAYSHRHHIVHRDVKPANILFNDDGVAMLSDFGIARSTQTTGATQPGMIIGSLAYMAPEQLKGQQATGKADVYALALVLVECLTGEAVPDRLRSVSNDPSAFNDYLDGVDSDLVALIARCLQAEPDDRPSADEMAAELERISRKTKPNLRLIAALVVAAGLAFAGMFFTVDDRPPSVSLNPPDANIYIDGQRLVGPLELDGSGTKEVVLVLNGYYGQVVDVDLSADDPQLSLQPWSVPTYDEYVQFNTVTDRTQTLDTLRASQFKNPVFAQLLRMNIDFVSGNSSGLKTLKDHLVQLAENGDAPAQLALFLANDESFVVLEDDEVQDYITRASQAGYPLATFYAALNYRLRELNTRSGQDEVAVKDYIALLRRAEQQGLTWARNFIEDAERQYASWLQTIN